MGFQKDVESIIANVKKPGEKSRNAAQQSLESTNQYDGDEDDDFGEGEDQDDSSDEDSNERKVQMLLFSATMPGWICKLTDKHMKSPVFLDAVQEGILFLFIEYENTF